MEKVPLRNLKFRDKYLNVKNLHFGMPPGDNVLNVGGLQSENLNLV